MSVGCYVKCHVGGLSLESLQFGVTRYVHKKAAYVIQRRIVAIV